jgi:hypothetical protein
VGSRPAIEELAVSRVVSHGLLNFCCLSRFRGAGGGEVSGGGTLYMKWGAGSLRYRECVMRERVVKLTHTLISHTSLHLRIQNKIIKYLPKKVLKYSEF